MGTVEGSPTYVTLADGGCMGRGSFFTVHTGRLIFYGKVALWPKLSFPREIMMMIVTLSTFSPGGTIHRANYSCRAILGIIMQSLLVKSLVSQGYSTHSHSSYCKHS